MQHILCFGSLCESVVADVLFRWFFSLVIQSQFHILPCTRCLRTPLSICISIDIWSIHYLLFLCPHLQLSSLDSRIKVQRTADGLSAGGLTSDLISSRVSSLLSLRITWRVWPKIHSRQSLLTGRKGFKKQTLMLKMNFDSSSCCF